MRSALNVTPEILRRHPDLDRGQMELISHLDGPILGVAGPGTGKTLAIALRAVNILLLEAAEPEELVLCTYNKRAAAELRERFEEVANSTGWRGDLDRVRIGTIHSLCHRLLRSHAGRVDLGPDFQVLNEEGESALLAERFDEVFGPDLYDLEAGGWRWREPRLALRHGRKYFDRVCDELISAHDLAASPSRFLAAVGRCFQRYEELLLDGNLVDFGHLQSGAVRLLDDDAIADGLSGGIRHLICDEYQDTSYAQERLLLRMSGSHGNLCVVGDDDQSLYRFRGATVQNILEFDRHFPRCRVVRLDVNHRSHPDIVGFYDRWMADAADWSNPDDGAPYRRDKTIVPHNAHGDADYPAVIAIEGNGPADEKRQLVEFAEVPEGPGGHHRLRPGGPAAAFGAGRCGRGISGRPGKRRTRWET